MADFPLLEGVVIETIGALAASSRGTSVISGAANTKGSYVNLTLRPCGMPRNSDRRQPARHAERRLSA